jgi:hypothetical protein
LGRIQRFAIVVLKASTPDGEIPTDHDKSLLFREASKRGIKYIINGMNLPRNQWLSECGLMDTDWKYIRQFIKCSEHLR